MENQHKTNDLEELKKLAPTLSSIEKENNFSVPPNYFDKFPFTLKDKIDQREEHRFQLSRFFNFKSITTVGISIALLVLGIYLNTPIPQEELTADEIHAVLEFEGDYHISDEVLADAYFSSNRITENTMIIDLSEDEIMNYLEEEYTNISELYYEL